MKRAVSLTIAVLLVAAIINCAPALSVSATPETLVENVSPAILCDVGEPVALSGYSVDLPDRSVLDSPTWYSGAYSRARIEIPHGIPCFQESRRHRICPL